MNKTLRFAALTIFSAALFFAQQNATYKVRLSPVAMDAAMRVNIAGSGSATATLQGTMLMVTGNFTGLKSPATIAQIHRGVATGVRGPAILELTVSPATSGTISGSLQLTQEQIASLRKGQLYIQIHSERAPDGNLWGWLLP